MRDRIGRAYRVGVKLLPLDLDLNRARPAERGAPYVASPALGREIAADIARLSEYWGTRVSYDEKDGTIAVTA